MIAKFFVFCLFLWPVSYFLFIFFTWIDCGLFIEPYGEFSTIKKVMKEFFWDEEKYKYTFWAGFPYLAMAPLICVLSAVITIVLAVATPIKILIKKFEDKLNEN